MGGARTVVSPSEGRHGQGHSQPILGTIAGKILRSDYARVSMSGRPENAEPPCQTGLFSPHLQMLGTLPVHVHLGQRHFPQLLAVPGGRLLEILESFDEFLVCTFQGLLRVDPYESGIVD